MRVVLEHRRRGGVRFGLHDDECAHLVGHVFDQVAPSVNELDRDNFFEVTYEHFAEAGVWELYAEVPDVLEED